MFRDINNQVYPSQDTGVNMLAGKYETHIIHKSIKQQLHLLNIYLLVSYKLNFGSISMPLQSQSHLRCASF